MCNVPTVYTVNYNYSTYIILGQLHSILSARYVVYKLWSHALRLNSHFVRRTVTKLTSKVLIEARCKWYMQTVSISQEI